MNEWMNSPVKTMEKTFESRKMNIKKYEKILKQKMLFIDKTKPFYGRHNVCLEIS